MPKKDLEKDLEVGKCNHFIMNPAVLLKHLRDECTQVLPGIQAWAAKLLLKPDWVKRVGIRLT